MQISAFLAAVAAFLPIVYGAPTAAANSLHPDILAAMKRDLGLDAEQAHARVARELQATDVIKTLESKAGFAGAWLVDGDLKVAVTDEALTSEVSSAGAEALVVDTPLSKLQEAQKAIDALDIEGLTKRDEAAKGIGAYYVDVAANNFRYRPWWRRLLHQPLRSLLGRFLRHHRFCLRRSLRYRRPDCHHLCWRYPRNLLWFFFPRQRLQLHPWQHWQHFPGPHQQLRR